jgi:hypothetical protein
VPPKNKTPSIDTLGKRESLPKSAALGGTAACRADLGPLTAKLLEQQREIARLTAERDDARREVCGWAGQARNLDPNAIAMKRGWNVKVKHEPDAKHDRPEEVVIVKVGRHKVQELKP